MTLPKPERSPAALSPSCPECERYTRAVLASRSRLKLSDTLTELATLKAAILTIGHVQEIARVLESAPSLRQDGV